MPKIIETYYTKTYKFVRNKYVGMNFVENGR